MDSLSNIPTWLLALGLSPLIIGFVLMLLPPRLWQHTLPRWEQNDTSIGILAAGLMVLGLALALLYSQSLWKGWRSESWQATPGVMMESRLLETHSPRSTTPYWQPRLRYLFSVNGQVYEGSRLSFDWEKTTDREALQTRLQEEWFSGAAVTVWVNPANPAESVLKQGASGWLTMFVGVGLVLLGVGAYFLQLAVQGWREHRLEGAKPKKSKKMKRSRDTEKNAKRSKKKKS